LSEKREGDKKISKSKSDNLISIQTKNLGFIYKSAEKKALTDINLEIYKGKFVLLCGPTGSGKTSLIRTFNGLIPHFYHGKFFGYVYIKGKDTLKGKNITANLSKQVGSVFQIPENQLFSMDVERELAFGLENLEYSREEIKDRIENVIKITNIEHLRHRAPFELSGGEQQKVAIASVLALDPEIIVLDEPLSNLDPKTAIETVALLKLLQKEHSKTIIISEHRLEYLLEVIDEILIIDHGKAIKHDTPNSILDDDHIYSLGVDLPPIINWFKNKKSEKLFEGPIPISYKDQLSTMDKILSRINVSGHKKVFEDEKKIDSLSASDLEKKPSNNIITKNISFNYLPNESIPDAIHNISISLNHDDIIAIMGPNGAGKSTFIRCLLNLLKPQSGDIWIADENIKSLPVSHVAGKVGLMFQNPDHQLFANSIVDELKFSLKNLKLSKDEEETRISKILEQLDLTDLKDEPPFNVSGGQKKKVSLAAILCRNPEVLIFDEPTIGQDATQKQRLISLIREANVQHKLVIIVSHDMEFIAELATRVVIIRNSKIFAEGTCEEVFTDEKIINAASLKLLLINKLTNELALRYSWMPKKIITISQLEKQLKNLSKQK
jgi:energy-coupling factor transport system ATP-binding protein